MMLHVYRWNWGYQAGIVLERPGIKLCFSWVEGRRQLKHVKYGTRHDFIVGPAMFILDIDPKSIFIKTARCQKCGRIWPAESRSPRPQAEEWHAIAKSGSARFRGSWEREVDRIEGERLIYGRWKWIGPCCELSWSGYFGEDDYEDDYEDEEWETCQTKRWT